MIFDPYNYMREDPRARAKYLTEKEEALTKGIAHLNSLTVNLFGLPSQQPVVNVGRIACDTSEGKLNPESVLLTHGPEVQTVPLDLRDVSTLSLFPGQVVAVEGVYARRSAGDCLVASKVYDAAPAARPKVKEDEMQGNLSLLHAIVARVVCVVSCLHPLRSCASLFSLCVCVCVVVCAAAMERQQHKPLTLLVSSGPYSTLDNLDYEPLADLGAVVERERPDVLILVPLCPLCCLALFVLLLVAPLSRPSVDPRLYDRFVLTRLLLMALSMM